MRGYSAGTASMTSVGGAGGSAVQAVWAGRRGFGPVPLQFRRNGAITVELGDQVGDGDPVGVVAGRGGGGRILAVAGSAPLPRRGAW